MTTQPSGEDSTNTSTDTQLKELSPPPSLCEPQPASDTLIINQSEEPTSPAPSAKTNAAESSAPEASAPEASASDASAPETSAAETSAPETKAPETSASSAAIEEADDSVFTDSRVSVIQTVVHAQQNCSANNNHAESAATEEESSHEVRSPSTTKVLQPASSPDRSPETGACSLT